MNVAACAIVVLLAIGLAILPVPPSVVEQYYSNGAYPLLQIGMTWISNRVPFALLDVLIVLLVVWWMWRFARDTVESSSWTAVGLRALLRTAVAAAVLYVAFMGMWGFNYRRVPLVQKLQYDAAAVTEEDARRLVGSAILELNSLYAQARESGAPPVAIIDSRLANGFKSAEERLGVPVPALPGRPKTTLLDVYFRTAGVDGMTDPYFLETLVVSNLFPFERPFVVAHEWSHLAGIADEGDANFMGWLACLRGDERTRYSGWLFLYNEASAGLAPRERTDLARSLAPGPRADLNAIAERNQREIEPAVARMGWRVYDHYLKANRVQAGTASYAEVVRLVLGTRFEEDWTPKLR